MNNSEGINQHKAATKIQARFRGNTSRNIANALIKEKENEAATKIQARFRGYTSRKELHSLQQLDSKVSSKIATYIHQLGVENFLAQLDQKCEDPSCSQSEKLKAEAYKNLLTLQETSDGFCTHTVVGEEYTPSLRPTLTGQILAKSLVDFESGQNFFQAFMQGIQEIPELEGQITQEKEQAAACIQKLTPLLQEKKATVKEMVKDFTSEDKEVTSVLQKLKSDQKIKPSEYNVLLDSFYPDATPEDKEQIDDFRKRMKEFNTASKIKKSGKVETQQKLQALKDEGIDAIKSKFKNCEGLDELLTKIGQDSSDTHCTVRGDRFRNKSNEDRHVSARINTDDSYFADLEAIFDGHGGADVSEYCQQNSERIFSSMCITPETSDQEIMQQLQAKCIELAAEIADLPHIGQGSTAIITLDVNGKIFAANIGDCEALVMTASGKMEPLAYAQTPEGLKDEITTVLDAEICEFRGVDRISFNGMSTPRHLAAHNGKAIKDTLPLPTMTMVDKNNNGDPITKLVLACDGIAEGFNKVRQSDESNTGCCLADIHSMTKLPLHEIKPEHFVLWAILSGSKDSMSVTVKPV